MTHCAVRLRLWRPAPWRPLVPSSGRDLGMKTYSFTPDLTFREARRLMAELSSLENRGHIAKLIWMEGKAAGESLTFLWDPMAERFGHNIDKEPIDHEIVENLINEIAVDVQVSLPKARREHG